MTAPKEGAAQCKSCHRYFVDGKPIFSYELSLYTKNHGNAPVLVFERCPGCEKKEQQRQAALAAVPPVPGIQYDINKRWAAGTPHHPKSEVFFKRLAAIDFHLYNDRFEWRAGGDGENGETLMFELDIIFEEDDAEKERP